MLQGPELFLVFGLIFGGANLLRIYRNGGKQTKRATLALLVRVRGRVRACVVSA